MKKLIAHPLTWSLYYLGDISFKIGIDYFIYNHLMVWSLYVQQWGGLSSPWKSK